MDSQVLDPAGPSHGEADWLLLEEIPPATALRPLLDTIGAGALPGARGVEVVHALFVPDAARVSAEAEVVDARTVMALLE